MSESATSHERCVLSLDCEHPKHAPDAHPCGLRPEPPGTPCRYCGDPVPLDGSDCPKCWQPITVPMFRAWCASLGWDTTVELRNPQEGGSV